MKYTDDSPTRFSPHRRGMFQKKLQGCQNASVRVTLTVFSLSLEVEQCRVILKTHQHFCGKSIVRCNTVHVKHRNYVSLKSDEPFFVTVSTLGTEPTSRGG
jgi:hypothetical protein